jgi:hypothetical protein
MAAEHGGGDHGRPGAIGRLAMRVPGVEEDAREMRWWNRGDQPRVDCRVDDATSVRPVSVFEMRGKAVPFAVYCISSPFISFCLFFFKIWDL